MFAAGLTIERDPLGLHDLPAGLASWVQSAGGYALAGVVLWLLIALPFQKSADRARIPAWQKLVFVVATLAGLALYLVFFLSRLDEILKGLKPLAPGAKSLEVAPLSAWQARIFTLAGVCGLVAALVPFLRGLLSLRWRRIYALAKLSFKEALRRRVLYAFSALLLVFLFASWFIPAKPEDQVRSYVQVVFFAMTFLLLFTAAFIAAFSIPTDIRQLTIHTVVTKPVERFEIVLGRFLGFTFLMTIVLLIMTSISLLYVLRGVGPDAAAESLKARVPVYGDLYFENTSDKRKADNVGREWDYRQYISAGMPGQLPPYACFGFAPLSGGVLNRDKVRCEFTFDIYRTTKGYENRGVSCYFLFHTGRYDSARENQWRERRNRERQAASAPDAVIDAKLAEQLGFFEVPSKSIVDYHTQSVDVPAGLFRRATQEPAGDSSDPALLPVQVRVKCNSRTQYIGMARYDLYFRTDNVDAGADRALFAANFYKGALGLWFRLCLITGVAVCLSTYLTGVISMVLALLLYLGGLCQDFVQSVAFGTNIGGGPTEAFFRLVGRETVAAPRDEGTTQRVAVWSDTAFRWLIRRVQDMLPDVDRFDLSSHVAEGFNISGGQLTMEALLLLGYLLPWFVLAYFVMKWREIATW